MSYINGVLRIIEELIRIVNKLKKLIAKTMLYLNFVESDEFLRLTFYLIWTKDVKFGKNFVWNAVPRTQMAHELYNGMKNWSITGL